jgi:hypothetical protein
MIGFISTLVTSSVNHIYTRIQRCRWFTHTGPLLVPQLKRRNHNSLAESHTPRITHEWSLQIFTGRRNFRGYLLPRTQNWIVAPFAFKITPLQSTDPTENTVSHCCGCMFTLRCLATDFYISVIFLDSDRVANSLSVVEFCLLSRCLATLRSSTLQYVAAAHLSDRGGSSIF